MSPPGDIASLRISRLSGKTTGKQGDIRTPGQVDRDRILYCTAFRRLAEITQVVRPAEGHQFHNRLTHVLKVAQIGRRIAERLQKEKQERISELGGLDVDVVEAAGLAHDLGHPPFGHVAEEELQDQVDKLLHSKEGFEGNAQSFRIVTKLAVRTVRVDPKEEQGLDLTRATLNAILKYPWLQEESGRKSKKWGAYSTEKDEFEKAREAAPDKNNPTLEAALMDWADDIAYAIYDLDDFYRARLIPFDRLIEPSLNHVEQLFENIEARWKRNGKDTRQLPEFRKQFMKLLNLLGTRSPLKDAYTGSRSQRAALRDVTSYLVNRYAGAVELSKSSRAKSRSRRVRKRAPIKNRGPIKIEDEIEMEVAVLQELAWTYVIEDASLAAQQEGQREMIRLLFKKFSEAAENKQWRIFPASMMADLKDSPINWAANSALRTRVVIDLIASMTEYQAAEMYRQLTGYSSRSVMQRIIG
jgi:dGTPase